MLDIKFIRQSQENVQQVANDKGINVSIAELLSWDEKKRQCLHEAELLRQKRNSYSQQISQLLRQENVIEAKILKQQVKELNRKLALTELSLAEANEHYNRLMLLVPNVVSPDTPIGQSDSANVEVRRVGERPSFDFEIKDHVELGEIHDIIDIPRGVKVAGSRNYYLKGNGLYLHRAVQQLAVDYLSDLGFTLMDVPLMARQASLINTGFFPTGQDQTYEIANEEKWLVGTSEVPLVAFYSDEIIDVSQPMKLAGISLCFRSEVGSAGRDVRGLYRVHQFAKVEQVIVCQADPVQSERLLQEITQHAEDILQLLELPYRVVAVCTGDMSQKTYKQYDVETWMPSRQAYGETHSSSHLLDFQARRSNIRYRDEEGTLQFCHTLNNTAVATPRILIPLLENHQQADGSIYVPNALRKYMNGVDHLYPKG